jgi:hypothetical protein
LQLRMTGKGIGRMRIRARYWVMLSVVAVVAAVVAWRATRPAQYALRLTPMTPPTAASCISETDHYGWSAEFGAIICKQGNGRNWYRAVLTNRGSYGLPACTVTGFDRHEHKVFSGPVVFGIGGIRGLFVAGHSTVSFIWYLADQPRRPIAAYTATCSPSSSPFAWRSG